MPLAQDLLDGAHRGRQLREVARLREERLHLVRRREIPGDGDGDQDRLGHDVAAPERVHGLLELPDNLERRAERADRLVRRIVVGEELLVQVAVDDADACALQQVVFVEEPSAQDAHVLAHLPVVRHDAEDGQRLRLRLHRDVAAQRHDRRDAREEVARAAAIAWTSPSVMKSSEPRDTPELTVPR